MKRLYKSETNKTVSGVCAGIAQYFTVDPTLVRVGFVLVTLFTGFVPGLLAYIVLSVIMPKKSEVQNG